MTAVETPRELRRTRAPRDSAKAGARPPALLLGGGIVALSVGRRLDRLGIPVIGLGDGSDPLRHSRHRSEFVDTGSGDGVQDRWLSWLEDGPRRGVVLPCSDDALELVARNRPRLTALGYAPVEADDEVLLAMLDKAKTADLARMAGIEIPRTTIVSKDQPLPAIVDDFAFPCALKPRESHLFAHHYGMRKKLFVVDSRAEMESRLADLPAELHMIATEIVPGPDRFCSYYSYIDEQGAPLFHYTKQKLRQYPTRFGLGTYHRSDWNPEVAEHGLRFMQAVGLRGLGCVEFKRDARDGRLKLIECNHRFTAATSLVQACGVDVAQLAYNRAAGLPGPTIDGYRRGLHLWAPVEDTRAFVQYRRSGDISAGEWLRSLARPQHLAVGSLSDPVPGFVAARGVAARALRQVAARTFSK
jgi:D-aspartate ligase